MSVGRILTLGLGAFGGVEYLPTLGFTPGAAVVVAAPPAGFAPRRLRVPARAPLDYAIEGSGGLVASGSAEMAFVSAPTIEAAFTGAHEIAASGSAEVSADNEIALIARRAARRAAENLAILSGRW